MEDQLHADVVEPPRYITARHVSAVFERIGYDAAGGAKLFNILCEALAKRGQLGVGAGMGHKGDDPLDTLRTDSQEGSSSMPNAALVAAFATEEDEIKKLSGWVFANDCQDLCR